MIDVDLVETLTLVHIGSGVDGALDFDFCDWLGGFGFGGHSRVISKARILMPLSKRGLCSVVGAPRVQVRPLRVEVYLRPAGEEVSYRSIATGYSFP